MKNNTITYLGILLLCFILTNCTTSDSPLIQINKESRIVLIGNNLCSGMMNFGHFETELHLRFPDSLLFIRNMCDGGNTPGFRPHSGRKTPWAFPGAEKFQTTLAQSSGSEGTFESPDEWLTQLKADIILAFFGYNESFEGQDGINNFKAELDAFLQHSTQQKYNGKTAPQLVLISPIAFQDLSEIWDLPNGKKENENLALYTKAMAEIAKKIKVSFVDVFTPSLKWFSSKEQLTIDGFQLNEEGYVKLAQLLYNKIFVKAHIENKERQLKVLQAVNDKNWFWHNDFKIPNGVHVFGRRFEPFGPDNYPAELKKIREMTAIRDTAIWMAAQGKTMDVKKADQHTTPLPPIETNYQLAEKNDHLKYRYGQDALDQIKTAKGYKIELFASEQEFPDLANPVQISFDNKGRLWVATMPSYPHYKPGDQRPDDKLIILEDKNNDGKADHQITFADGLHLPIGFEFSSEGVFISQGTNLKLYTDTNKDDKADKVEIVLSGFDDHDTHHAISAFCADPSGAIYMAEGIFLHSNVETSYGPVRATNGGFFRYNPKRKHLERTAQLDIPNPWGIAFDEWGQPFFAETSGPPVRWMMPGTVKPLYGITTHKSYDLIDPKHQVRPTSGLEFISSRHFPENVQGDLLINNTIGFLGTKQHQFTDDRTGYSSRHRQDLLWSTDQNFRPVDMEFAPDGSLYLVDWHNVLIGHMQHNARDPLRDHVHGRIYRITYPSRPLVKPAKVADASIPELFNNLTLPEYRTRYRTRRELRSRPLGEVAKYLNRWIADLNPDDPKYEHHLLEALWVSWGINQIHESLLLELLNANDFKVRVAAVRVLRYIGHQINNQSELLQSAAKDDHGRVRLEAIVAASWMEKEEGLAVLAEAAKKPLDKWMIHSHQTATAHLNGEPLVSRKEAVVNTTLKGDALIQFTRGKAIYEKEGYCGTCHQNDGKGLPASGFPPLAATKWVQGVEDRLIKLTLHGLYGSIEVLGQSYPGQVPMTPYKGLLNDEEIADVLTYIRNAFGNQSSVISSKSVKAIRDQTKNKNGFYSPEELLLEYPMERN